MRLVLFVIFFWIHLHSEESLQNLMIQDLDVMRYHFSIRYAPYEWKKEVFDWDVDTVFDAAKRRIWGENPLNDKQYQKIVQQILLSTNDYHVTFESYLTEWAYFPLRVKGTKGRYFLFPSFYHIPELCDDLTDLETLENQEGMDKIFPGDELLAFNGIPIQEVVESIIDEELYGDRSLTGYAVAERLLFERKGKYGQTVPFGQFQVTVKHRDTQEEGTYTFFWIHRAEKIQQESPLTKENRAISLLEQDYSSPIIQGDRDIAEREKSSTDHEEAAFDSREKGFLPPLGSILWETEWTSAFYAYLYKNPEGHRIGYLYIPSFMMTTEDMKEIVNIMQYFKEHSVALVVDITDNVGGRIFFMYALLSTLTDRPLELPSVREMIIQEDVYNALMLLKLVEDPSRDNSRLTQLFFGYPIDDAARQQLAEHAKQIIHCWECGQTMTGFISTGIKQISPHPEVQYTQPIIVLVNPMNFSCGDFFPAILQDNQRGVIFGQKTAGAGGYVKQYPHTSRFGIKSYSLTTSMVYRLDGIPIENRGVTPDISYEPTVRDLQDHYVNYIRALNAAMNNIIESS